MTIQERHLQCPPFWYAQLDGHYSGVSIACDLDGGHEIRCAIVATASDKDCALALAYWTGCHNVVDIVVPLPSHRDIALDP